MQKALKKGFTMVELSLAIVFISMLSIIVVLIITNAVSSYRRGMTLNQINTTGMDLVDELKVAIQGSPARSLEKECSELYTSSLAANCTNDHGTSFAVVKRYGTVRIEGKQVTNVPIYGAFCTGKYSYVWNSGYFFGEGFEVISATKLELKYKVLDEEKSKTGMRLLKVNDENRMVCKVAAGYDSTAISGGGYLSSNRSGGNMISANVIDISKITIDSDPEEILEDDGFGNLALYDLTSATPAKAEGAGSMFYDVSFILGTLQGGVNVKASGNNCKTPGEFTSEVQNFDYCAINKFNFAAQAIGG